MPGSGCKAPRRAPSSRPDASTRTSFGPVQSASAPVPRMSASIVSTSRIRGTFPSSTGLPCEQRRGEDRQRGVLVPGRLHASRERAAPLDHERLSQGVLDDGLHGDGSLPIPMNPTRDQAWETPTRYTKAEPLLRHASRRGLGRLVRTALRRGRQHARRRPPSRFRLRDPSGRSTSTRRTERRSCVRGLSGGRDRGGPLPRGDLEMPRDTPLKKALFACDELSGFVTACGYVRPDGIATLEPKSVRKKLKQPSFAAGASTGTRCTAAPRSSAPSSTSTSRTSSRRCGRDRRSSSASRQRRPSRRGARRRVV